MHAAAQASVMTHEPAPLPSRPASTEPAQAWDAALYDRAAAFVPRLAADLVDKLAPRAGERILDLGSGTGELTRRLADAGARVIGLDASEEMVAAASRRYPELTFVRGDGQALAFVDELDAVFSNATLHWMPRAADVAAGVHRALRPGGRFVAELGGAACCQAVRTAATDVVAELGLPDATMPAWYFPTPGAQATVLERAGFRVREVQWFERPTRFEGETGVATWLALFCAPFLAALGARREEAVQLITARCRPALHRDGAFFLDYTRLRFSAEKPARP
jgi:trans-aconitate methyltransferase